MSNDNKYFPYRVGEWADKQDLSMLKKKKSVKKKEEPISDYIQTIKTFRRSIQSILNFRIVRDSGPLLFRKSYRLPSELKEFYFVYRKKVEGIEKPEELEKIPEDFDIKKIQHFSKTIAEQNGKFTFKDDTTRLTFVQFRQHDNRVKAERKQDLNLTLLNLASVFEVLVNKLLEYHLLYVEKGPGSIGDRKIEYLEIHGLDKIEIKKKYVDKYISDVMYKPFDSWIQEFYVSCCSKKTGPLEEVHIKDLIANVSELFQRRNIIIHNNGIINNIYKAHVPGSIERIGTELEITDSYLEDITKKVSKLGNFLIISHVKKKKLLRSKMLYNYLSTECLSLLMDEHFEETRMTTEILRDYLDFDEENTWLSKGEIRNNSVSDFIHRYNYWLSFYLDNKQDMIRYDIDRYIEKNQDKDWFIEDSQIQLGICSLTKPKDVFVDTAISYCDDVFKEGKLNLLRTLEWPMFNLIKDENKFVEYSEKMKYTEYIKASEGEIVMLNNNSDEMKNESSNTENND